MSVIPATWEAEEKKILIQGQPGKSMKPYLKNKLKTSKRAEGHGLSSRVPIKKEVLY
jgi:hypothetical protein